MTSIAGHTERSSPRPGASRDAVLAGRRRVKGLAVAFAVSAVIWAGVIVGIVALVNAVN